MKKVFRNPFAVFALGVLLLALLFFTVPINLFDGETVFEVNGTEFIQPMKLSLSYFIGIGVSAKDLEGVKEFHLTGKGYMLACLMLIGFPALIAYRVWINGELRKKKQP